MNARSVITRANVSSSNRTVPEIKAALRTYDHATTRREALKALGVIALLRSVYQQGVRHGQIGVRP